jgi:capsular polysaccharide biosynthesis protein
MALLSTAVKRLRRLLAAIRLPASEPPGADLDSLSEAVAATRREVIDLREKVNAMARQVDDARQRTESVLAAYRADLDERAQLAAIGGARLRSDSIVLAGSPSARLRVRRVSAGQHVELPFQRWMGITRCVSAASDVRDVWERLLAAEAEFGDGMLRGGSSTILDVPHAVVSKATPSTLSVQLGPQGQATTDHAVVALPRFAYAFPQRKLRNFSHWLLDCVPQAVALSTVSPDAVFLLPPLNKEYHQATLSLVGLESAQMVPWDGNATACDRVLILENDGRAGGGRPLSSLLRLRHLVTAAADPSRHQRRIYVSRRDAKRKRRWLSNEPEVEALFESRGFEVLCMADYSFSELVRTFRDAAVVAGLNGAGLAHILFSRPGVHVIVLFSDSLIRWHADESGSRSLWRKDDGQGGQLTALGDSPRFYAHVAAAFEQHCHSFVSGDDVPLDLLSAFLDDVLSQANTAWAG